MLKSVTVGFLLAYQRWNAHWRWLAWVIGDGMLKSATVGFLLAYRWRNAYRLRLLGLSVMECSSAMVSFGYQWRKLKSVVECSNWRRLGFFWLIRDEMLIGDGCFGYRWRNAHWRCNAHRWRLASVTVGSFGLSASGDDGDGVGVLFGVQTLGSEMK